MSRVMARTLVMVLFLLPMVANAQGLLVVVDQDQIVRLPRPYIIWHPHPHPHPHPPHPPRPPHPPHPRPIPPPTPPATYKIKELNVQTRLTDQIAKVQVSQSFVNTGSRQMEVSFVFPLPYDGAIEQMTLLVDGKEFPAQLLDADKARKMYEAIVRKNKDPALLEWMGTGLFKTSVFPVPAGAERTVSLRYSQLCRKQDGLTDFLFPLSTAKYTSKAVEKVSFRATIESQDDIKNVYSPTHEIKIKRPDDRHATISYESKNEVPTTDFRLLFDTGTKKVSTRVLSYRPDTGEDGYFLLLASPKIKSSKSPPKKTVAFVVDRSGSMSGKKIEQAREAARFVLENLRPDDLFNVIAYDSQVESFRPEMQRFDDESRRAALGFIEGVYAGGSTNINGALSTALGQLQDSSRPNFVLFLTDGLPTAGETNEMKIVENAKKANALRARIFSFGVGYDVNSRLLDKLVRENFGQSEYVRPDEDIEDRVSRLYRRIESPVMTDVQITFELDQIRTADGKPVNLVYPKGSIDLFAGEQLALVGRYKKSGTAKVVVRGSVNGKKQKLDFPAKLSKKSNDDTNSFIEKLWAVRRVGEILDELDLKGKNQELIKELVDLSTRHGILTPYTSFLADENTKLHDVAANTARADQRLFALENASGESGFRQRALKGSFQRAANAYAPDLSMPRSAPAADGFGPGDRGKGYGRGQQFFGKAITSKEAEDADEEIQSAAQTVRNIGNRAFYRRDKQWIDSTLTKEQQKPNNVERVQQFSDEYFALARRHGRRLTQYLVFDEPVLVNVDNRAYLIEP